MKKIILFLMVLISFTACNNTKEEEEILQANIIETHDVLMLKGETIMANKESLNQILENTANANSANESLDNEAFFKQVNTLNNNLTKADDAMMTWMNNFNPDFAGKNHTQIMEYLNKQKIEIEKVESLTEKALNNSNMFIKKYKK